jgi:hypothetical protein
MAELTDAQKKRQEARKRRRGNHDDGAAENESGEQPLVNAAKVAAAGAAVGAAAAAARALTSRHEDEGQEEEQAEQEEQGSAQEPEPEQEEEQAKEPEREEPQAQAQQEEEEQEEEPVEGASLGDAKKAAGRARDQLEELLGKPVESVSSLERTHDGWVVALEVVELQRIPESTDVLASYELELDGDLNFRRYQQARRYTRSQASRGDE